MTGPDSWRVCPSGWTWFARGDIRCGYTCPKHSFEMDSTASTTSAQVNGYWYAQGSQPTNMCTCVCDHAYVLCCLQLPCAHAARTERCCRADLRVAEGVGDYASPSSNGSVHGRRRVLSTACTHILAHPLSRTCMHVSRRAFADSDSCDCLALARIQSKYESTTTVLPPYE